MKKFFIVLILVFTILGIGVYYLNSHEENRQVESAISVSKALSNDDTSGYKRAVNPRQFIFPLDLGPHPGFKTEWWYYTGNLNDNSGHHYGYQLTIFRIALSPDLVRSDSKWRSNQMYMAHFTLTDVDHNKFYSFERFSRGAEGLAGASISPLRVWLEDWEIQGIASSSINGVPAFSLKALQNNISVELTLKSIKPVVLQGERGLSRKGPEIGNASYYYSLTRLESKGSIRIGEMEFPVNGLSWMDREWSTSALSKDQEGWDWFSLQLNDGREIMYYQMREKNGSADKFSNGTLVFKDGSVIILNQKEIRLKVLETWKSPHGNIYPSRWSLSIPNEGIDLEIIPYIKDQELNVSIRYWEGAVKIKNNLTENNLYGSGYVELTGYEKIF